MQRISLKTGVLAFTFVAIASLTGSTLTACSNAGQSQVQAPTSSATDTNTMEEMQHKSSMNHSMAMDLGAADANYDLRFIDGMALHHRGAIEMAKEAEQKSQRPEIKKLARNMIISQNREENELLQKWRKVWYPKAGSQPMAYNPQMGHTMQMSSDQMQSMMMKMDLGAADADFDLRFMNAMIPHHEGAVTMAQDALNKSKRSEVKQLAQDIITSQSAEIEQMNQWKQAWYKK